MTEPILDFLVINPMDITYGSTHRLRQLTSSLRQDGYRVEYIESNYSGSATDIISVPQTNNLSGFLKGTWKRLGYVFRLNYRILFTQTFTPLTAPLILVAKLKGRAVVVDWDDLGYPLQANLLRAYLVKICEWVFPRICDLIVTPSRYIQSWGRKRGVKKIFHLPHGVDLSVFKSKPKNIALQNRLSLKDRTILVFLASFTTGGVMDLDVIVEAARRVEQERAETTLLIIGGGPSGLTAGIYAVRSGLRAAVVEREALGGQVATTPIVGNYPGFTSVGGKTLVDIMVSHALQYVQIFQGEAVMDLQVGKPITVVTTRRKFLTKSVLLATGATHLHLNVPGESRLSGRGVSYCSTCDGPLFKGKKVVMAGGGNSAVTEALHLFHMGVDVTLIHRRDKLRAQDFLVKQLSDNDIAVLWDTEIKEIRGKERVEEILITNNKTNESSTFETNGVFIAIGYTPAVELAQKLGVEVTADGYIKHDGKHRTNIPGVYSAGDVEGGYKQIVTASGQGAEAAMTIFEDLINPYWLN